MLEVVGGGSTSAVRSRTSSATALVEPVCDLELELGGRRRRKAGARGPLPDQQCDGAGQVRLHDLELEQEVVGGGKQERGSAP